jgi:hypothetical protein
MSRNNRDMFKRKPKTPVRAAIPAAKEILTDAELAAELGVLPRTLRLWRHTRALPHVRLTAKVIRYRRSDIDAWLDRSRTVIAA